MSVSLLALYNAQQMEQYADDNFVIRQLIWFAVGACFIAAIQFLDIDHLYKASTFVYIAGVLALMFLLVAPASIAAPTNGAKSWFQLFGVTIQPAEFVKIAMIMYMARVIVQHRKKNTLSNLKTDFILLTRLIAIALLPVLLILMQPDFGTAMVYLFIAGIIIILSGISWRILTTLIAGLATIAGSLLAFIVNFPAMAHQWLGIEMYQINRILTWFNPTAASSDSTYHIERAMTALGSGQLFGKGMADLEIYYPEAQTDFIFAVIGESFGFIGSAFVIFLYFIFMYKLVTNGLTAHANYPFAAFYCFGFLAMIMIHVFQNVGMSLGIMPVTGIPLLLISYGGSSVLATMIGFGVFYRIAVENSIQGDYLFK